MQDHLLRSLYKERTLPAEHIPENRGSSIEKDSKLCGAL